MAFNLTFTDKGITAPTASEIKSELEALFSSIWNGIVLDSSTPQGQLIMSLTTIIMEKNAQLMQVINSFNPERAVNDTEAGNLWQDALGALYLLQRKNATRTVVTCQINGLSGTILNAGVKAINEDGELFSLTTTTTIPASGFVLAEFQADKMGAVECLSNTLNRIYTQVNGWDSINNPSSGIVGQEVESREAFENRRKQTLGKNALATLDAVTANLLELDDVVDVVVRENDTGGVVTVQGYDMIAHSLYAVVLGGVDTDIAQAIFEKKSAGCQTQGEIVIPVTSEYGSVNNIKFDRPTLKDVYITVNGSKTKNTPDTIGNTIKELIIANIQGNSNDEILHISETLYASRLYNEIVGLPFNLLNVKVGLASGTQEDNVEFNLNELGSISAENITINIQ